MTKSPTARLLLGLFITLAAVTGFSWYSLLQLNGLRKLQTDTIDLNRHDSLLLLRVQNDVNTIGLKLRDMTETSRPHGIGRYRGEFARLRKDLEEAVYADARLRPAARRPDKQAELVNVLGQFWRTSDEVFQEAAAGDDAASRALISTQLSAQQSLLATQVAQLLQRNTEAEARTDKKVGAIYNGVEWKIYAFLAGTMVTIAATTLYLIYSNRRLFGKLESLSLQRRVLAAKLITIQEEVLRSVSRELHDEFGQILTAVSTMLARAERRGVPVDSPLRTELREVRQITHHTLEKMRSLSQMLHPAVLDDYGLAKGIEWYAGEFQRQAGVQTAVTVTGEPLRITGQRAIHCFRIVQEALTNAARHSGAKTAEVEMIFETECLTVKVKDFGRGIVYSRRNNKPGLGLIAMRERAELLNGKLNISSSVKAGTTISLTMPLRQDDQTREVTVEEEIGELVGTNND